MLFPLRLWTNTGFRGPESTGYRGPNHGVSRTKVTNTPLRSKPSSPYTLKLVSYGNIFFKRQSFPRRDGKLCGNSPKSSGIRLTADTLDGVRPARGGPHNIFSKGAWQRHPQDRAEKPTCCRDGKERKGLSKGGRLFKYFIINTVLYLWNVRFNHSISFQLRSRADRKALTQS
jgi:hypothetical protein